LKSCYGLKQAGHDWFQTLKAALLKLGFTQADADQCVFILIKRGKVLFIALYVDDMACFHNSEELMDWFVAEVEKRFKVKDLGNLHFYLGMLIQRNVDGSFKISQPAYIEAMEKTYADDLGHVRARSVPVGAGTKLTNLGERSEEDAKFMADKPYRALVGSLLFSSVTCRPDIATAVQQLSQNLIHPHKAHWTAALQVLAYLCGTKADGIVYRSKSPLRGFTDSNWGGDTGFKSTSGHVVLLSGAAVAWGTKTQKAVAISSCEAELYAASVAVQLLLWARMLLKDLKFKLHGATFLGEDNEGTISALTEQSTRSRMKHVGIRKAFAMDAISKGHVKITWISTKDNVADFFTKLLPKAAFDTFKAQIMGESF